MVVVWVLGLVLLGVWIICCARCCLLLVVLLVFWFNFVVACVAWERFVVVDCLFAG